MDIADRVDKIRLHVHGYAFFLNFKHGDFDVMDLLDFAKEEGLNGVDVNIASGDAGSLRNKSRKELETIKLHAENLGLDIDLDISSTSEKEVVPVVRIAKTLGVRRIRVYVRHHGHLSGIVNKAIEELGVIAKLAEIEDLQFFLEQHEATKSNELVGIIEEVNSPRVNILFDFGNMINANERPLDALKNCLPYIQKVHLKDVHRVRKGEGYGQVGAPQGKGDIPQKKMLAQLLSLGESEPQVQVYSLQQSSGYRSPPYRFNDEAKNPIIPERGPSNTPLDIDKNLKENLDLEVKNVCNQVVYLKNVLNELRVLAKMKTRE